MRRHALGYPVRGQNTRNNASTAKKLNRVDRKHYSSYVSTSIPI
jgi:small subunit ribosomal protein S13